MEHFQKLHNRRLRAIIALMTAIALFFTVLLYLATIANGLSDGESTELNTVVTTATENAARGNITDRYGEVLATWGTPRSSWIPCPPCWTSAGHKT